MGPHSFSPEFRTNSTFRLDRRDCQMVTFPRVHSVYRPLPPPGIHPRSKEDPEGSSTARLPSRTFGSRLPHIIRSTKPILQFLVSRAQLARVDPRYRFPGAEATPYYYNQQQQYYMHTMPPPPVYDPNSARPPVYPGPPPEGATKVDPSQQQPASGSYAPPPGPPPPSTLPAQNTGSNPFRQ